MCEKRTTFVTISRSRYPGLASTIPTIPLPSRTTATMDAHPTLAFFFFGDSGRGKDRRRAHPPLSQAMLCNLHGGYGRVMDSHGPGHGQGHGQGRGGNGMVSHRITRMRE